MKKLPFILLIVLVVGCKESGSDPSPIDAMKSILTSGSWQLQSVTVDNVDKTSTYAGLTLSFTATAFTATNGHAIWPASGSWQFSDDSGKNLLRGDQLPITIGDATTSAKLVLSLNWNKTTYGSGRVASVKGNHVFTLGK
jgi:hypothetical protein